MSEFKPKARSTKLLRQELDGEVMLYDVDRNHAHCLNDSAARIWALCDGERTVSEIAGLVGQDVSSEDAEVLVTHALHQFTEQNLLEVPVSSEEAAAVSRRQAILRIGLVAALVPMVDTIVAPPAAWAQSGSTGATGVTGS